MKKTVLLAAICAITIGSAFGQFGNPKQGRSQTLQLVAPGNWTPGTQIVLDVNLTFTGYTSVGYSYWLEVPDALAPFLSLPGEVQYFSLTDGNQSAMDGTLFNTSLGADPGWKALARDLGATSNPDPNLIAGFYHIATMSFTLDAGASGLMGQSFTMHSTSINPRLSEVSDTAFNDNNIMPPADFVVTIVPEPSTLALLGLAVVGSSVLVYRRRKASR